MPLLPSSLFSHFQLIYPYSPLALFSYGHTLDYSLKLPNSNILNYRILFSDHNFQSFCILEKYVGAWL